MNILFLMIPVTLILAAGFVTSFLWATQTGQFDDLDTPAHRMLHEENKNDERIK